MTIAISMSDVQATLETNFEAGIPVALMGASGIGKTEMGYAYAEKQGEDYGLFELNLATASLPDVIGLQMPVKQRYVDAVGETQEITVSEFAYPYFMFDVRNRRPAFTYQRALLILEEYGQGTADVKRACAPIIRDKRNGFHLFPKNTDVLILSNRPEDRSGVSKDFDFLINRRNQLLLNADLGAWLVWAHEHGVSSMSMAFAARNEDKVFANKAPEKQGPWLTPRSLKSADDFLKVALKKGHDLDSAFIRINLCGIIGEGYAHVYIAFAKIRTDLPSLQEILDNPLKARLPDGMDRRMFLAFDLAAKAKRDVLKPMVQYMGRMQSDMASAFYRAACQRDKTLASTKEFGDWSVENHQLLAAVLKK